MTRADEQTTCKTCDKVFKPDDLKIPTCELMYKMDVDHCLARELRGTSFIMPATNNHPSFSRQYRTTRAK